MEAVDAAVILPSASMVRTGIAVEPPYELAVTPVATSSDESTLLTARSIPSTHPVQDTVPRMMVSTVRFPVVPASAKENKVFVPSVIVRVSPLVMAILGVAALHVIVAGFIVNVSVVASPKVVLPSTERVPETVVEAVVVFPVRMRLFP